MSDISTVTPMMLPFRPPPGLSLPGEEELSLAAYSQGTWNCALYPGSLKASAEDWGMDSEETTPSSTKSETDPVSEDKEVRKLEKKLRDIEKLEAKQATGERLDPLQVRKVEKKHEVEEELQALKERLTNEAAQEEEAEAYLSPPPGFAHRDVTLGKLAFNTLRPGAALGASLVDTESTCEDDATTLPGSAASDQGADSDSESQFSELLSQNRLSAHAPVFVPPTQQPFVPFFNPYMAMPFVPFMPEGYDLYAVPASVAKRTPLKNTASLFTPKKMPATGKLKKDAPPFIMSAKPMEDGVTWKSTHTVEKEKPKVQPRTKLTSGSTLFVPEYPELQASVKMKKAASAKAKAEKGADA